MKQNISLLAALLLFAFRVVAQQTAISWPDTVLLDEVVVLQPDELSDANKATEYSNGFAPDIDRINARLGGMSLINRGSYAMEPAINSFTGGQINVTIDGMKMFGACTDKMDPITSYVEPANLRRIALLPGSMGSANGSTVGGTFNMDLQVPKLGERSWAMGGSMGSAARSKETNLMLNLGGKQWAYRASGVYKHHHAYTDGLGQTVPHTQYGKLNLHQSLLYQSALHRIKLDVLLDDARNIGYAALPMDVSRAVGRIYALDYAPTWLNNNARLSKTRLKLYANTVYHLMDDSGRDSLYLINNRRTNRTDSVFMRMDMPGWSNTYGGFAETCLMLPGNHCIDVKLENYQHWAKADMTMFMNNRSHPGEPPMFTETWPESRRSVLGLYLRDRWQMAHCWQLSIDFRADHASTRMLSEQGKPQFSALGYNMQGASTAWLSTGNLALAYSPNSTLLANAGVGLGERLPTLSEMYGFYLFNALDGYDYLGKPDLKPESSLNGWLKLAYQTATFRVLGQAQWTHVQHYIVGQVMPQYGTLNLYASGVKQYHNLAHALLWSANLQTEWQATKQLELFNVLKYNYGSKPNGQALPLILPLKNVVSARFSHKAYYVQIEGELSAKQNRFDSDYGEQPTPAYGLLHLRTGATWQLNMLSLKAQAGVENALNKAYSEHLDWGNYHRPGRNIYLGLSVSYRQKAGQAQ